ncbi:MAG: hypothetical protein NT159_17605 [Proteobacteria bacterium]|nr:hypothetical protein [Pseudomonadota bacterium]
MSISNQQYLDRLAEIGKHFEKDECLPDSSRQLFSKAMDMAEDYHYESVAGTCDRVEETFSVLCEACKSAGLHQCKENQNRFLSCQLVWNYSS